MKLVYKPEGVEPRSWDFEPNKLLSVEAEAIEKLTGMTFAEWIHAVGKGSVLALHALLWVMLKRSAPTLKYQDVQFTMDELDFIVDDDDAQMIVDTLTQRERNGEQLNDDERRVLDHLLSQGAKPTLPELDFQPGVEPGPKAVD